MTPASKPDGGSDASLRFGPFTLVPTERRLQRDAARVRLGGRAMDVLIHLARRAGEVVGHKELVAHVWAGAQVEESNLRYQVASLRRALAQADPAGDYIVSVPGRGYTLAADVRALPADADRTAVAGARALPRDAGEVVGRSEEIAAVVSALRAHRLVTLVGVGGIGKTTVAVAAARRVSGEPGRTACFVDLSVFDDPRMVAVAVASAAGITVRTLDPVAELIERLDGQNVLLVLDTCEHVIDAAALLIERLLSATDGPRVLATSRHTLQVTQERAYPILPLGLPPVQAHPGADPLGADASRLFCARAALPREALRADPEAATLVGPDLPGAGRRAACPRARGVARRVARVARRGGPARARGRGGGADPADGAATASEPACRVRLGLCTAHC